MQPAAQNVPIPCRDSIIGPCDHAAPRATTSGPTCTFRAMIATPAKLDRFVADVEDFLSRPDLAAASRRTYSEVLRRLAAELDHRSLAAGLGAGWPNEVELEAAVVRLWSGASAATWNRNTTIVRSLLAWAARHRRIDRCPMLTLDRRREHVDTTRAIPYAQLERFLSRDGLPVRDRCLYRMLYETAARASEILSLDVEEVDLQRKRARVRSKGGDLEAVYFQSGAARLLPRIIGGRRAGPLFLTDLAARTGTPTLDTCPETGRARLSYRRAAALFSKQTGGWTLHQLRHSAITHYAAQGIGAPLLMAKSRHRSIRTLGRYARPGEDAVAQLTAGHDPGRRRT